MPRYNVQKRRRLDNLTEKHNRRMRKLIKRDLDSRVRDIRDQLDAGFDTLQDKDQIGRSLRSPMTGVYGDHEFDTVRSALSDGIQEVTPQNELGLWKLVPEDSCPIITLEQIRPQLGKKRDQLTEKFLKKQKKRAKFTVGQLGALSLRDYLSILSGAYRFLADDWIQGESTIQEVLNVMQVVFKKNDHETKRIFRTETTNYFNRTRADYFISETSMDFMQIFAITDGRTSEICETRHEWVFPIEEATQREKTPAFHPHCRTIQRPLTTRLKSHKVMIDKGLAMDERQFAPLPKNWS